MKIKCLTIVVTILFLISYQGYSKPVDQTTARKAAIGFFYEHAGQLRILEYKNISVQSEWVSAENGKNLYYAFNFNKGGWIMVSADDRIIPVIAYSPEGMLDKESKPDCFEWWMQQVKKQIASVQSENLDAADKWAYLLSRNEQNVSPLKDKAVTPLTVATWDQGKYYNAMCPLASGGPDGRAVVGCVATSMAQIMYYWRWPIQGNGSHGGINFGTTYYRWNEMLNSLSGYNTGVAQISYHAGEAVDMNYSASGSGAQTQDVPNAMKSYFRYSTNIGYAAKQMYTTTNWNNKIKTNLDAKHPIIYTGWDNAYGGHAWVCDGYQGTDYFHMNWGWSGSANGYFYLNSLVAGGYDFTSSQSGVFDIYPPSSSYPSYCTGTTNITYSFGTIEDGSGPVNNYQNNSSCSWLIAPTEVVSKITVSCNMLNTEAANDVITIYDGDNTSAPVLGTWSGTTLPSDVQSTGNKVLVVFTTNSSTVAPGWQIEYRSSYPVYCSGIGTLTAASGSIDDGSGTNNYSYNELCRWHIWPTGAGSITISFTNFNVASDDWLKITDEASGTDLVTYTGTTLPSQATYNTGKLFLTFKTNGVTNAPGWALNYTSSLANVEENPSIGSIKIYPVPASGKLFVSIIPLENQSLELSLYTIDGRKVFQKSLESQNAAFTEEIDISSFSGGIYILKLAGIKGVHTTRVIIE